MEKGWQRNADILLHWTQFTTFHIFHSKISSADIQFPAFDDSCDMLCTKPFFGFFEEQWKFVVVIVHTIEILHASWNASLIPNKTGHRHACVVPSFTVFFSMCRDAKQDMGTYHVTFVRILNCNTTSNMQQA